MSNKDEKKYYSTAEAASILGLSRIEVFRKIKAGKIKAERVGRSYVIPKEELGIIMGTFLTEKQKQTIDEGVKRTVKEYGETLRNLGRE